MSGITPVKNLLVRIKRVDPNYMPPHWSPNMYRYCDTVQSISHFDRSSRQVFLHSMGYYWYNEDFVKVNNNE